MRIKDPLSASRGTAASATVEAAAAAVLDAPETADAADAADADSEDVEIQKRRAYNLSLTLKLTEDVEVKTMAAPYMAPIDAEEEARALRDIELSLASGDEETRRAMDFSLDEANVRRATDMSLRSIDEGDEGADGDEDDADHRVGS